MSSGTDEVRGKHVVIHFEGSRCIHSRNCVLGRPDVFVPNAPGAWIHPDAATAEDVAALAKSCPSGAIRYERLDGSPQEAAPPVNVVRVRENGPLAVHADLAIEGEPPAFRATLCRCGASKNKPFCDGSHNEVKFTASGEPPSGKTDMLTTRDGVLAVEPQTDGPVRVRGNLEIVSGTGRVVARVTQAALCRCGGSANKPFCDGTHARIGFRSGDA